MPGESQQISSSLQCGETLSYQFTSPRIIIISKAVAAEMVHFLNKGRELAVIQNVSYLAILERATKTHCFALWQAEIISAPFLSLPQQSPISQPDLDREALAPAIFTETLDSHPYLSGE